MGKVFRIIALLTCYAVLGVAVMSQDLGTSNKLFRGGKPAVDKTGRKPASKLRAGVKKTEPKRAASRKTTSKTPAAAKSPIRTGKDVPDPRTGSFAAKPSAISNPKNAELFENLITEGNAARNSREYAAAEAAYRRALGAKLGDPRAAYGLGNVFADQQRWEDAEKAYRSALQNPVADVNALIALSYVLTQPVATSDLSSRYGEAERLARKAIEIRPDSPLAYDQLGVALELGGLIGGETESSYRKAIQLAPDFAPAYAHLGRLLRLRGRKAESAEAYKAAEARAESVPVMILVADVFQSEQRYADSAPLLKQAVANDPRNPTALLMLGRALIASGSFAEAESLLREAADVTVNGFYAYSLLGRLYTRQGRHADAEGVLLTAARFASKFDKLTLAGQFEALGDGFAKERNSSGAVRAYRKAREYNPDLESVADKIARLTKG